MSERNFVANAMLIGTRARRLLWVVLCAGVAMAGSAEQTPARTVTDMLGRSVTVPDRPLRLVSLAPSITETVFALGRGSWLVGVTAFCDYPAAAQALPKIGGTATPSLEDVVARQPDLVLTTAEGNTRDFLGQLDRLRIPTFALRPDTVDNVLQSIAGLGAVLDARPAAAGVIADIQARLDAVAARLASQPRPRVLYLIWTDPVIGAGPGSYLHDLITRAGGQSVVTAGPVPYPRLSWEQIVGWAPEVILLASHSADLPRGAASLPAGWATWQAVPAIRDGRVIALPDDTVLRPGPRVGEGVVHLAEAIHPEARAARRQ